LHESLPYPNTAASLNNLAALYRAQGNYAAALPLYARALAISEQALGADHPNTATSLNNLAVFYAYRGDFATAIPLIERALAIRLRTLGLGHPNTVSTEESLASMRQASSQHPATPQDTTEALTSMLAAIAAIAARDEEQRPAVEQALAQLEQQGRMLRAPVIKTRPSLSTSWPASQKPNDLPRRGSQRAPAHSNDATANTA